MVLPVTQLALVYFIKGDKKMNIKIKTVAVLAVVTVVEAAIALNGNSEFSFSIAIAMLVAMIASALTKRHKNDTDTDTARMTISVALCNAIAFGVSHFFDNEYASFAAAVLVLVGMLIGVRIGFDLDAEVFWVHMALAVVTVAGLIFAITGNSLISLLATGSAFVAAIIYFAVTRGAMASIAAIVSLMELCAAGLYHIFQDSFTAGISTGFLILTLIVWGVLAKEKKDGRI